MKKNDIAVFAVMAAAACLGLGFAHAGEAQFDFDGRKSAGFISAAELKENLDAKNGLSVIPAPEAAAVPAHNGKNDEIKIKTLVKSAGRTKEETLTCQRGLGADMIANCRKSDLAALSYEEVNTLALRQYFSAGTLRFADLLNQSKHSYTNQSGPMTFSCKDACYKEETWSIDLGTILLPNITVYSRCVEWTHECECTAGCD